MVSVIPGITALRAVIPDVPASLPATQPPDTSAWDLAATVEDLVCRLRQIARKDRRVAEDTELCDLAVEALWQAQLVKARCESSTR